MSTVQLASANEARALTDQIKTAVEATWELIKRAYQTRAWELLGYESWDDYCTREFGTSRLRLPREERREVVSSMREIGMSHRAIASATGESRRTVQRALESGGANEPPEPEVVDAEVVEDDTPVEGEERGEMPEALAKVVGLDGKEYSPKPKPAPTQRRRPPLPAQFGAVAVDLGKVVAKFERLIKDDRYRSARGPISDRCVPEIRRAVEVLQDLLDDLGADDVSDSDHERG